MKVCQILTPRKTFLIGFAIAVKSVFAMAEDLFNSNFNYKYLLTYKCSHDHLEILFSRIRQRLGNNNNPNVVELKTSLKKMLLKNTISSSYAANCMAFDNTSESIFEICWLG
ncbi:THAP-type domain-containing protein [Aphis craccivora]|uniref:THAP-type domain-containing protein n=1 Tax=Aphis craccivora TaxID=307492 RepID=A0A6G0VLY6_APHCR|nr:THAP-type domain-containing protein [Aphis craccivora]